MVQGGEKNSWGKLPPTFRVIALLRGLTHPMLIVGVVEPPLVFA